MTDKYTLRINISGVDSLVNELIEEHLSATASLPEHQTFTLSTLLSALTEDEFIALQENKNFSALMDLFEFKKIAKHPASRIENDDEISPNKISDSNLPRSSNRPESTGQFDIKLPNPNTSITNGNLDLPWNINKLITRLRNVSRVRNISGEGYTDFKLGEVLSDVISLKEEDILRIEGIGSSYLNSLRQLHDLYKDFDPTYFENNERKSTTLNLDLTGLEIVKLGMSDDEVNFIDAMVDNEFDVSLEAFLNFELSLIKSLPLIGPAKREGFRTLKVKLLAEIEKIISGEIVLEKYESRLIRDSKIEVLDIEILDRVILEDLEDFLSERSPREVDIVQSRLGFIQEQLTLETLGKKYEIDRERVRQIERKCRDNFLDSMRINPEKIWILIRDQLDSSLPDRMPLTYDPFDSEDCFYDFLSFISSHSEVREYVLPKSAKMGILDECFANEGNLLINQAEEYLEEYSNSIGTSPSNILNFLVQNKKISVNDNCIVPVTLPKQEAVAYILSWYDKGLPWMDISKLINLRQIANVGESWLDSKAFDSEYIFQCDRGKYKHIKYFKLTLDISYIFSSLHKYLSENSLSGIHIKDWHDHAEDQIKSIDYYELRFVLRSYAKDYGYCFDGKSGRDNISNDSSFKTVTQREIILNKMLELGKVMTKQEVARLIRSESTNHASLYLAELIQAGQVVQVDFAKYTTPNIVFKNIDIEQLTKEIVRIVEDSVLPVDSSIFELSINQNFGYSYSKYFYASIALQLLNEKGWYVVQNKIFWNKPISFNSLADISRQCLVIENSTSENFRLLLNHVLIAEKEAKNNIANWRSSYEL